MDKDFWEKVCALNELAGKATQGEWVSDGHGNIDSTKRFYLAENLTREDADYIAAANPEMILEMIAEMRRLEKEAGWLADKLAEVSGSMFDDEMETLGFQCSHECEKAGYCPMDCRKKNWRESARQSLSEANNAKK